MRGFEGRERSLVGLRKVSGVSVEDVASFLGELSVPCRLGPRVDSEYVRDVLLLVEKSFRPVIVGGLGEPEKKRMSTEYYFARYAIGEGFDWKGLQGPVMFDQGLLVERVGIEYQVRERFKRF